MRGAGSREVGADGAALYERTGADYNRTRHEDPRLAHEIHGALGDARSVVNVGAGTGHYEPRDREVVAVEPSAVMRAQRPPRAAPVIDAAAEALPFPDACFDAALSVLSDHHWRDHFRGLAELRRVARRRVVLFTWDPATVGDAWLVRDYLPAFGGLIPEGYRLPDTARALGGAALRPVPIPHDCRDGFLHAYWRRPHAYLDPEVRAGISVFAKLAPEEIEPGLARLARDLSDGTWEARNGPSSSSTRSTSATASWSPSCPAPPRANRPRSSGTRAGRASARRFAPQGRRA